MTNPIDLHALADGHLDKQEAAKLREACKADPTAAAELDAILNLKDCLSQRSSRHENEVCWKTCVSRLNEIDRTRRVEGFVGRYAWIMCAAVFGLILSGRYAVQGVRGDSARVADLTQLSLGGARTAPPQGSVAMDHWLDTMLGQVRPIIDPRTIHIVGGVRGSVNGLPVARLDMRDGEGYFNLFVIPGVLNLQDTAPMPSNPQLVSGTMNGENCVAWTVQGRTMVVVAPREADKLQDLVARISIR